MLSKIRPRSAYDVMAGLALFLVVTGGTAVALSGSNTVFSDDITNGNVRNADLGNNSVNSAKVANGTLTGPDLALNTVGGPRIFDNSVTGADVNESTLNLAAENWQVVPLNVNAQCGWGNFNTQHNTAAFLRDRFGFVHLKGLVNAFGAGCDTLAANQLILQLPAGYRPALREVHATISNEALARINVDGPAGFGQLEGAVSYTGSVANAKVWISLDGISFRCAPSGSNGCP